MDEGDDLLDEWKIVVFGIFEDGPSLTTTLDRSLRSAHPAALTPTSETMSLGSLAAASISGNTTTYVSLAAE